ncbi:nuclease-related domain-containing protein [Pseudovibrio sp. Tun.PSC04-5.I4]|uniref:nuclease-related domain-containing protein n=1 Tax=Pseudovibrio sp. Tun.PSC04-5.I4 TaxID=1798213 RepID=UPI000889C9CA|nr:nuclease-related domain-containing protein [Pseudovibrio sp. Tun.PSC04-5.I4]SDQ14295.1 Nuclease-related domain-containing protein [Pseudovibrio sp. Tun.PSC04-5.I4]
MVHSAVDLPKREIGWTVMIDTKSSIQPKPRSVEEIFEDLRSLAHSNSALHEISNIIYRDWVTTIDVKEERVADSPEQRWSTAKLNNNELLFLIGLMVQSPSKQTYLDQTPNEKFAACADKLFREFHDRMLTDCSSVMDPASNADLGNPESIGLLAREAIYYGAEGFYLHQFPRFTRQRYRNDMDWLLSHVGISIRPMIEIAEFLASKINEQMTLIGHRRKEGHQFSNGDLTNSLLIAKSEVREKFGNKADAFFEKFVTPITSSNLGFTTPFAVNDISIAPIIELEDHLYITSQYRLFQSLYESPFFWMMADKTYRNTHSKHRGEFLEETTTELLRAVFGPDNVFENVTIERDSRGFGGEIDVLVNYGEFVLVIQAKSKRVTQKARSGDAEALRTDFNGAIQAPYRQALECIKLIKSGAKCVAKDGRQPEIHNLPRFFPMVVLSDTFPASTLLSRSMLQETEENCVPVIWDIGMLDCIVRLLPNPVELIFYLKSRSDVFSSVLSDSEHNYLGYHIGSKLALPPDYDLMVLERDYAMIVDDFMMSADVGVKAERPIGILERLKIPVITELLNELKHTEPEVSSLAIDLYDFSSSALEEVSQNILDLREEIAKTGKAIKAFSILTGSGGFSYAVVQTFDERSVMAARSIGLKNKYETESDRWYVLVDSVTNKNPIDGLLALTWPWKENLEDAVHSAKAAEIL